MNLKEEKIDKFLSYLKEDTIENALMKSELDESDFRKWYNEGKREFYRQNCNQDSDLFKFYMKITETLMGKWIEQRKLGYSKIESCQKIEIGPRTLADWFLFELNFDEELLVDPKYAIFLDFYNANNRTNIDLLINAFKTETDKEKIAEDNDISLVGIGGYYETGRYFDFLNGIDYDNEEEFNLQVETYESQEIMHTDKYRTFMDKFYNFIDEENKQKFIDYYKIMKELKIFKP